jgi:hypothetical protein
VTDEEIQADIDYFTKCLIDNLKIPKEFLGHIKETPNPLTIEEDFVLETKEKKE